MKRFRRTVCWAIALLALAAGGMGAARAAEGVPGDPVLDALTEKPLMFLRLGSLREALEGVRQTRVGRHAQQEPLMASAADAWRSAVRFGMAVLTDLTDADLERLAGREVALVVLRSAGAPGGAPPVMVVADLGDDARLVERAVREQLVPRCLAANPRLSASVEQTASGTLVRWTEGGRTKGCMRFAGRLLALGPEEVVARLSLSGGSGILASNVAPEGLALGYLDVQALLDMALARMGARERRQFEGTGIPAVSELWSATSVADGAFRDTVVARLTPGTGGLLPALAALQPGQTAAARVMPVSHSALLTCRIESGEKLYEIVEDLVRHNEGEAGLQQFRMGMDQVDRMFAINLEWELLPAIGGEAFVAVRLPTAEQWASGRPPRKADFEPIWGFALRDEQLLRDLVERFGKSTEARQTGWQVMTEGHADLQVHTVSNVTSPVRFALAIVDGYCVCAPEADTVRAVIDAVAAGQVLAGDEQYQAACAALPQDANASVYLDTRPLRQGLLAVSRRRVPEAKQAFLPLLERLVPDVGGYAVAAVGEGDLIRIEGRGDLPALFSFANVLSLGGSVESHKQAARLRSAGMTP